MFKTINNEIIFWRWLEMVDKFWQILNSVGGAEQNPKLRKKEKKRKKRGEREGKGKRKGHRNSTKRQFSLARFGVFDAMTARLFTLLYPLNPKP